MQHLQQENKKLKEQIKEYNDQLLKLSKNADLTNTISKTQS